ncbi:MAG: DUF1295 domain-containing protein [Gammaproteobacteria bacterium]|nr:DUF1295 domain-containing protein [Gammaproteobacteria bacterium]
MSGMIPFNPLAGTPFGSALELCLVLIVFCWVAAIVLRENVWLDRVWSLCPPIYCLLVAARDGFDSARINLMTLLVLLWAVRLTFNFARKGGFRRGGGDYRWVVVEERLGPLRFQIANILFIVPSQLLLIWLFTSPIHQAWLSPHAPLGWLDAVAAVVFVAFLAGQTVGDQQMWTFQQDKKRKAEAGEEIEQPFIDTGLFRYSRHPSYLCEIGMWFAFYLFAVSASGDWLHWTGLGFIFLSGQMVGSVRLTETISIEKYPTYAQYQASTPMLVPLPRRQGHGSP